MAIGRALAGGEADVEVWPDCVPALELASACRSQLLVAPMGGMLGLRYESVEAAMNMRGVPQEQRAELLQDLQVIEMAMVQAMGER
ncbi:hypothetical protein CFN79_18945 [Chromobacterium vaccinii]|uniref:DUF1799 domain-containing protein n=1 Tax=Chromobacterium vaccinii TaxID=1108595 RepID=UPI000CE943A8|nr:DUF1799 domain-containing protein [Chromobacterium vaccinii]AVG17775.1 hypothetical protein CFN79_18945 [Chromobacterium vaccinii]